MKKSISVVMPVRNAQLTLTDQVSRVLEVLPEMTHQFELLIVDDGSTDGTDEIGHELTHMYPQVRFIRHTEQKGSRAAVGTGMNSASAEIVLVEGESDSYEGNPAKMSPLNIPESNA